MPAPTQLRYPWPSSALGRAEMEMLFHQRENGSARTPITQLIAEAVRNTYGPQIAKSRVRECKNQT